ncbi:HAD-superfamily hydrolase [Mycoavidus cysteinexigens]|uniref:HAD-superfamily hydrolase n=2 Tax=Mycoavidus cysteinexigens TaxID=1553431 RepID=A0A2Z6EYN8_9BURK|nr:HAD-superfamily hydrolase [Mycoavidus cysteinexigens]GLR00752.1 haloacid dehalogenase [Mycoavidus cysteinexigens]
MPVMMNLALFDLDHTLIPADSDYEWGCFAVRHGLVDATHFKLENERFYADYQAGRLDIHAYLRYALAPLARYSRAQLAAWHAQFMQEIITPLLRPAAFALIQRHQAAGDVCCIVTATNSFVTAPIARAFGINHLIAPEPATLNGDPTAAYTGEINGLPSYREGKIIRAEAWLQSLDKNWTSFKQSYFYSDSHNDIPLLEKVSTPIATNPDDKLRAHAQSKGWRILDLFKTS